MLKNLCFLIIILAFFACHGKIQQRSIEGLWSVVENDSLYYEIVFLNGRFWTYSIRGGSNGTYRIKEDSMEFKDSSDNSTIQSEVSWINDDEFTAVDNYRLPEIYNHTTTKVRTHQTRIILDIDLQKLISGDKNVFADYLPGFIERRSEWQRKKRKEN